MKTIREISEALGISRQGVNKWITKLKIRKIPVGKTFAILDVDFQRINEARGMNIHDLEDEAQPIEEVQPDQTQVGNSRPPSQQAELCLFTGWPMGSHPCLIYLNESEFRDLERLKRRRIRKTVLLNVEVL